MILLTEDEIAVAKAEAVKLSWAHKAHSSYEKEKYLLRTQLKKINDFHDKYGMWALKQALLKQVE